MSPARTAFVVVALLAMALKVMLPPGFMPGAAANKLPFALVLCTGYGPVELEPGQTLAHHDGDQPSPVDKAHDSPCAFAGQGAAGAASISLDVAATGFADYQVVRLTSADDLAPGRGLPAPPPPATGPPPTA